MTTRPRFLRASLLTLAALTGAAPAAAPSTGVTLILDPAGPWDKAVNEAASSGLERAVREHGMPYDTVTSADPGDMLRQARAAARSGSTLVIGVGRASAGPLSTAAREFPSVRFVGVDALPGGANTVGLRFREQEGGFLAGFLAANATSTRVLGVITGEGDATASRYRAGFEAGVAFACPDCRVLRASLPRGGNVVGASDLTRRQYARGADIILAAVGASNRGVVTAATTVQCLSAARLPAGVRFRADPYRAVPRSDPYRAECRGNTRPVFAIATESSLDAPGDTDVNRKTLNHTLTSVLKRADNAVFTLVDEAAKGKAWRAGDRTFGVENGGVELSLNDFNAALISPALKAKLTKVRQMIVNGVVQVPVQ
ncbi:BMP family lipoprotein [Deinococcus aestuarii]|uniref:BMP family lipoprotein n=1 Tax=Deinococcus aestuarii TaxID=2774531 RepID=UPI001C0CD97C|nr:BMP family ABC transporter substrate-binding protein [Deinococcus aestuarii]